MKCRWCGGDMNSGIAQARRGTGGPIDQCGFNDPRSSGYCSTSCLLAHSDQQSERQKEREERSARENNRRRRR